MTVGMTVSGLRWNALRKARWGQKRRIRGSRSWRHNVLSIISGRVVGTVDVQELVGEPVYRPATHYGEAGGDGRCFNTGVRKQGSNDAALLHDSGAAKAKSPAKRPG